MNSGLFQNICTLYDSPSYVDFSVPYSFSCDIFCLFEIYCHFSFVLDFLLPHGQHIVYCLDCNIL